MTTFVLRRLLWTIPVLLLVILFTFLMMRQIKGNPFRKTDRAVPAAIQANLDRKFHLDEPWYVQYADYVKGVFGLDLGPSLVLRNQSVNDIVKSHFPISLELGAYAFLFAIVAGVPLGMLAALRANKPSDSAGPDALVPGARRGDRRAGGGARGRRRQRREPDRDRGAVSPRDRRGRQSHRLRWRDAEEEVAARPRSDPLQANGHAGRSVRGDRT